MSNALTTYTFNTLTVRVMEIEGEPWFVASDVVKALGLYASEYRRLDASEKSLLRRAQLGLREGRPMIGVNESGLYKLIMRSDKTEAKAFQDWVTKEVLPSIRKTGTYSVQKEVLPGVRKPSAPAASPEAETIKLLAQAIDRLTLLQAHPPVVVEAETYITIQQYEADTHQVYGDEKRQALALTASELAARRGIKLPKVLINNHRSHKNPQYAVNTYPRSLIEDAERNIRWLR